MCVDLRTLLRLEINVLYVTTFEKRKKRNIQRMAPLIFNKTFSVLHFGVPIRPYGRHKKAEEEQWVKKRKTRGGILNNDDVD